MRPLGEAIDVEAGATCLAAEPIQRRVGEHVDGIDSRVRVRVVGDPKDPFAAGFIIETSDGRKAERRFRGAPNTCEDFVSIIAVAIVLAIDDLVVEPDTVETPLAPPRVEDVVPPRAPIRSQSVPVVGTDRAMTPYVGIVALGHAAFAVIPGGAGGASVRGELGGRIARGRFALGVLHGSSVTVGDGRAIGTLVTAGLDACLATRARLHAQGGADAPGSSRARCSPAGFRSRPRTRCHSQRSRSGSRPRSPSRPRSRGRSSSMPGFPSAGR